jgi:hypothetical protein
LRAINNEAGAQCYEVPAEATIDQAAANEAFGGDDVVIDVHTHYMADSEWLHRVAARQMSSYRHMMPDWWRGLDGVEFYSFAEYLRCVFLESETAVAVLTSPPPDETGVPFLTNEELAGTRELLDRLAGTGRLLNHLSIHPTVPESLETLEIWRDKYQSRLHGRYTHLAVWRASIRIIDGNRIRSGCSMTSESVSRSSRSAASSAFTGYAPTRV